MGPIKVEERRNFINITTYYDDFAPGKWKAALTSDLDIGATLQPEGRLVDLYLPRYTDFIYITQYIHRTNINYSLILHSEPSYFQYNTGFHRTVYIDNTTDYQAIKLKVQRLVRLNLRREPCEEDPAYNIGECKHKCFLSWLNCSLYGSETDDGKPTCMAYDIASYTRLHQRVFPAGPTLTGYRVSYRVSTYFGELLWLIAADVHNPAF